MKTAIKTSIILLLISTHVTLYAQGGKIRDKIETMKIGFITKKLDLSSDEAQKFWPVYNKFTDDVKKLRANTKERIMDDMNELYTMTDAEAEKTLQEMINFKINEAELTKKYALEFKKILPVKKVVLLYKAENDFKRELLKKLRQQRINEE